MAVIGINYTGCDHDYEDDGTRINIDPSDSNYLKYEKEDTRKECISLKFIEMRNYGVRDIERELQFLSSHISKACSINTNNNSAYGFYWSYNENLNNFSGIGQENKKLKIQQFSLNGELIKTWSSISDAAKETNSSKSSKSSIIRCCKNKQKTCNNFIWKYLNN